MKKLMLGLMMAFAVTAIRAEMYFDEQIGNLIYNLNTEFKTATITGYDKVIPPTKVEVDEVEYHGVKCTVIDVFQNAFKGCGLTSVSLPNATTIDQGAFQQCGSLTSVYLPNATTIYDNAFKKCDSLTSVSLPNATTIRSSAFEGCANLKEVSLPSATTIEMCAFQLCYSLETASLPSATTIEQGAFEGCGFLSTLIVNVEMKSDIATKTRSYYNIPDDATITYYDGLPYSVVKAAEYEVNEAVVEIGITPSSVTLKNGDEVLDEEEYKRSCDIMGISPLTKPARPSTPLAEDLKVVSKDAQVIGSDEIAVKKESIAAPSAGTVKVEDNKVQLGVTVLKTSDLTAEKKEWGEVTLTADDVKVVDGKIVISVPVDSASGFMVIQTKDAAK